MNDAVESTAIYNMVYHVQETIGGWRQNAVFTGTYKECEEYMSNYCHNGSYAIVCDDDYEIDYL